MSGTRQRVSAERVPNPNAPKERIMAVKQHNKIRVYHSLFKLNWAFQNITRNLQDLAQTGLMPGMKMGMFCGFAQELQSQISHDVVDRMHEIEDSEMYRWEKMRIAREKYLDPDRPR
ncbi:MAG TPA: hypothetical protein VG759_01755 [Candidatus Angelobacter sp.]|jgi:hypothetical protein|nr:hypothetical protein [Candidatus Angelobacter sp.]